MTFEIDVDGQPHTVAIERAGQNRYRVLIHRPADPAPMAEARVVNAVRVGDYGLSLVLEANSTASRELHVTPAGARGEFLVGLDGKIAAVTVNGRRRRRLSGDQAGVGHGKQSIVAPMPGRVVRVLVGPGDEVHVRQPLVVVEAMKMENELRSPKSGTIKEVTVSAGMSVEAGRVLVTLG
jgi:biotin carboxyl carrier protein